MLNLAGFAKLCKRQDPTLPESWEAFLMECLPQHVNGMEPQPVTHFRVAGAVPRVISRGKNKGQKTWRPMVHRREFIFSKKEVKEAAGNVEA